MQTLSSINMASLVFGSILMLKYPASLPDTMSHIATQLSVPSRSKSLALNLITSTPSVFSSMLPSVYREKKSFHQNNFATTTTCRGHLNSVDELTGPSKIGTLSLTSLSLMVSVPVDERPPEFPLRSEALTCSTYS